MTQTEQAGAVYCPRCKEPMSVVEGAGLATYDCDNCNYRLHGGPIPLDELLADESLLGTTVESSSSKESAGESFTSPQQMDAFEDEKDAEGARLLSRVPDYAVLIGGGEVPHKDSRQQLEFPIFTLSKKPDLQIRRYELRGFFVEVIPSVKGLATIFDKDILVYCASQIVAAINAGRTPSKTVRFTSSDFLKATNRGTGGASYDRMEKSLDRLSGTRLKTNVPTGKKAAPRRANGFGLIEKWEIVERSIHGSHTAVEVTVSDWYYNALLALEVLTLPPDYFRLSSPLDRALFEIARKHCGRQKRVRIRTENLHAKTGSRSSKKEFKRLLATSMKADSLPHYRFSYQHDDDSIVVISLKA